MPGMGRSLQTGNSLIVSSFHTALFHQFIVIFVLGALCAIGFNVFRTIQYRRLKANGVTSFPSAPSEPLLEPAARRILRIGFGALWIFDGLLQMQSSMPLGLPSGVIQPSASGSPGWVQHLVNTGVTIWSNHPIQAASATVWIQIGIGLWLLVAPRGRWSRFGGLASVGWGLLVWSFGRGLRGPLLPRGDLALRSSGRRPLLLRRRDPDRSSRKGLRHGPSRPHRALTERALPDRDGRVAGVAWQRVLAGPWGDADRHGPYDGPNPATGFSFFLGLVFRQLDRSPRLGGQPLGRHRLGHHRRPAAQRAPTAVSGRSSRAGAALPGRLGSRGGPGVPRWPWHRSQFHAAHGPLLRRRIRGHGASTGCRHEAGAFPRRCSSFGRGGRDNVWTNGVVGTGFSVLRDSYGGCRRRVGDRPGRCRSDGDRSDQRQHRPHPVRSTQRRPEHAAATGTALHPDRPTRPDRQSGQPPRPCGGVDLPRSGLHLGLPTDRPGVPSDGPAAGRRRATTWTSSQSWPTRSTGPSPSPRRSTPRNR